MKKVILALFSVCLVFSAFYRVDNAETKQKQMKINKSKVTIKNGSSARLKIKNCKKKVKWSTEDKEIATVSSKGKVTGKHLGTVVIKAKVGKKSYRCRVTVKTNINSEQVKMEYNNSIFTEELFAQVKEIRFNGKVVRDRPAIKKIYSMVAKWKLCEAVAPKGRFANTADTPPGELMIGVGPELEFVLANGEEIDVDICLSQTAVSRRKQNEQGEKIILSRQIYEVEGGVKDTFLGEDVAQIIEKNQVITK